jgi:ribosome-associated heat shock protein Hsp15
MRIDKYLWCTRYFKTRSLATDACKKGHVKSGGDSVKPSRDVFPGDQLVIRKNQINYELLILDIPANRVGAKLVDLYRKDITPPEAFENQEILRYSRDFYRKKGTGRPTKKDRRDLDSYADDEHEV